MHFSAPFLVIFHCWFFFVGVQFCAAAHVVGRARCALHICLCLCRFLSERAVLPHLSHLFCRGRGRGVQNSQQLLQVKNCYNYQQWWIEQICTETRKGLFFGSGKKRWLFCWKALVVLCHCVIWFWLAVWWRQHTWNDNGKSQPLWNKYIHMYNCGKICLFDRADICWVLSKKCYLHQTIDWCGQYSIFYIQ